MKIKLTKTVKGFIVGRFWDGFTQRYGMNLEETRNGFIVSYKDKSHGMAKYYIDHKPKWNEWEDYDKEEKK